MSNKQELLKLWKEVKLLNLPTVSYIQKHSIVSENEKDLGLLPYEQTALNKGHFPKSLYNFKDRDKLLIQRFNQWLEERASPHVMVNQLLDYKIFPNIKTISDEVIRKIDIDENRDEKNEHSTIYKTLLRRTKFDIPIMREDVYETLHNIWFKKVRLQIAEGKLEPQSKVEPEHEKLKQQIEPQKIEAETEAETEVEAEADTIKEHSKSTTIDIAIAAYIDYLETNLRKSTKELDQVYRKIGKQFIKKLKS